jgi:menaquinone-dependent protoporphyrinogen IX oxidase
MSKTLVMYHSIYGTTKKYAEWIAEELNGEAISIKKVKKGSLKNYDTIIIGCGLYAGAIKGINLLMNEFEAIKDKRLVYFTCGLADASIPVNGDAIKKRLKQAIPEELHSKIKGFYYQGGINYPKLSFMHKMMMAIVKSRVSKKDPKTLDDEDKAFIETYGKTVDLMNKDKIKELLAFCRD